MNVFEGSFLGDGARIDPNTVMECGVCWWVYDPAGGDEVWQVAPGTAFSDLPDHWRCPNCDAEQHQFMVLRPGETRERPTEVAGQARIAEQTDALLQAYRRVADSMRGLPVYNAALDIDVVGMRRCPHGLLAVVVTPWCMNLCLLPPPAVTGREGSKRELEFPSGNYSFIAGHLDGVGVIETCSLFSPMAEFEDRTAAVAVAEHAIAGLFEHPQPEATAEKPMSRRSFLRAGGEE